VTLRIGELCAGYGGLTAAVTDALDAAPSWYAEYDPADKNQHSAKILAHRWPGVPNHGDIAAVDWAGVEPVHILLGGYPCQGQSVAGKQLGEDDPRWLWPQVARAVQALSAPLVFFENVRNHLRIGFGTVLGGLEDLGYDVYWTTLKASAVGAPHHRDRLFILGVLRGGDTDALGLGLAPPPSAGAPIAAWRDGSWWDAYESLLGPVTFNGDLPPCGVMRGGVIAESGMVAPEVPGGRLLKTPTGNLGSNGGSQDPRKRKAGGHGPTLADEVEHLAPRSRRSCGELLPTPRTSDANGVGSHGTGGPDLRTVVSALLPAPAVADSPRARDWKNGGKDSIEEAFAQSRRSPAALLPTPRASDGTKGGPNQRGSSGDLMLPSVAAGLAAHGPGFDWDATPYAAAIRRWERILGRRAPSPVNEGGRLDVQFTEWVMGLPDGWVTGVPGMTRNAALTALGNGLVPRQGAAAFRLLLERAGFVLAGQSCERAA